MRASVIGLIALPIAASGVAAAAVAGFGLPGPPSAVVGQTATAGISGESTDTPPTVDHDYVGTAIEGIKPYLTVIDGSATLPLSAPILTLLSQLRVPPVTLAPLPLPSHGHSDRADTVGPPAVPGPDRVRNDLPPRAPSASSGPGIGKNDRPVPFEPHSAGGIERGVDSDGRGPGGSPAVPAPDSDRPPAVPGPPVAGGPPAWTPPHAGDQGRPPHAGDQGRPPHAGDQGRPPHAGDQGRPPLAEGTGTPPHADRSPDVRGQAPTAPEAGRAQSRDDHPKHR